MKKAILLIFVLVITLGLTGCPRYDTVRRVSTQQLNVQKAFKDNLALYFKHMSDFAKNQVLVAKHTLDDLKEEKLQNLRDKANDALTAIGAPTQGQRDANREQLGQDIAAWTAAYESKKKELDDLATELDAKHAAILSAYGEIIATQEVLDSYIQQKKYDEIIVDGLMDKLKINQDKVNSFLSDAANLADKVAKPPAVEAPKKETKP